MKDTFTNGLPRTVTQEDLDAPWGGYRDGRNFRCALCGYKFKLGDYWRWQYTNGTVGASGNPTVCKDCDGEDVVERWKAHKKEWATLKEGRFWYFIPYEI